MASAGDDDQSAHEDEQPLLPSSSSALPSSFPPSHRPCRDLPVLLLFLLLYLISLAVGIFSLLHRHGRSSSSSCSSNTLRRRPPFPRLALLLPTLAVTLLLSPLISLLLLYLLRCRSRQLLYPALPLLVLLPLAVAVYAFAACSLSASCSAAVSLSYRIPALLLVLLLLALLSWLLVLSWHRVELAASILNLAASALTHNLALLLALPVVGLAGLGYVALLIVFLVFAPGNGELIPSGSAGEMTGNCVWKQDWWVPPYFALAILTALWVLAVTVEAQVYVIGEAVARWYFTAEGEKPERSVRDSLSHAFGPSFGTMCFSGLTIGVTRIVRAIVDSAEGEEDSSGIFNCFLQCCARLLSPIDFLNKYTIHFAAISGEPYCSSARMTYELLRRNLLSTVSVETISTRMLVATILVVSAIYAIVVCAILKAITALGTEVYLTVVIAWGLLIIVLGFFIYVLDNVVDTMYICYAIDKDKGEVSRQEVHEVYVYLPVSRAGRASLALRRPLLV